MLFILDTLGVASMAVKHEESCSCNGKCTILSCCVQGLQSAVNYTCYVAGRDDQAQPNYANPATLLPVRYLQAIVCGLWSSECCHNTLTVCNASWVACGINAHARLVRHLWPAYCQAYQQDQLVHALCKGACKEHGWLPATYLLYNLCSTVYQQRTCSVTALTYPMLVANLPRFKLITVSQYLDYCISVSQQG